MDHGATSNEGHDDNNNNDTNNNISILQQHEALPPLDEAVEGRESKDTRQKKLYIKTPGRPPLRLLLVIINVI